MFFLLTDVKFQGYNFVKRYNNYYYYNNKGVFL